MHTFMDNFHECAKYYAKISSHQAELRREENMTHEKYLSISSLKTDYLNLYNNLVFGRNNERANYFQTKCTFYGGVNNSSEKCLKRIRQEKENSFGW